MFANLNCHSYYTFSAGTIPADELPKLALDNGMTSVALTDTNNLTGAIEFYKAAKKVGIKPIFGVELSNGTDERVVLLAKNNDGYREICETVTKVLIAIPQVKPKITYQSLVNTEPDERINPSKTASLFPFLYPLSEDVIVITSSPKLLANLAQKRHHNMYIGIVPSEAQNWPLLRSIYQTYQTPVLALNDVYIARKGDYLTHKVLKAIGLNTNLGLLPKTAIADLSQYFQTEAQLRKMLPGVSDAAYTNTSLIADQCNVDFDMTSVKFAKFQCDDSYLLLRSKAEQGFWQKYNHPSVEHIQRFGYELDMIAKLGAVDYFLATNDMIEYAKRKNFPYLTRGSGANSFIAYCLDISCVDPIENNLRFERFLNPERLSPPDFDCDFSWTDRYEVINYMLDKYGRDNSAMLCTIQTYKDRGSIREIGKAFGFGDAEIKTFYHKLNELHYSGKQDNLLSTNSKSNDVAEWLLAANQIMGYPRHLSVHAGGVILADKRMSNYCPTQMAPVGIPIMQLDMFSAEDLGLVKLDILATRGLGTYWDTLAEVERRTGIRPKVENDVTIAFNDEKSKAMIRKGEAKGVFYVESPAMGQLLRKLQVDNFKLLTAASSIIRPGVASSGMLQEFVKRHHDPSLIRYPHPKLEELLSETYGVMIYQEDVLNVVHGIAGLSYGQADMFRRAMSGKLRSKESLQKHRTDFINGCIKNGIKSDVSEELWRQISSFSGYSFCKAHSASYAILSFKEAWLKAHHPAEFLSSVLNNYGGFYSHQEYINEAKHLDVEVLLPDVNRSEMKHRVEQDHVIRLGFEGIREMNHTSKDALVSNRQAGGRYRSFEDFIQRSGVTSEDAQILISLGACDLFGMTRHEMQVVFASMSASRSKSIGRRPNRQSKGKSQVMLELETEPVRYDLTHLTPVSAYHNFRLEKKYLGYSVTNHPCDFLPNVDDVVQSIDIPKYTNRRISVIGYVASTKHATTRPGQVKSMINDADRHGMVDVVIWPEQYKQYYGTIVSSEALKITGKVQVNFGAYSLIAESVTKVILS